MARAAALELIAAAERKDRPIDQRIADYEEALDQLKQIEQDGNLAETIKLAQREVERLRLQRDFFGS